MSITDVFVPLELSNFCKGEEGFDVVRKYCFKSSDVKQQEWGYAALEGHCIDRIPFEDC